MDGGVGNLVDSPSAYVFLGPIISVTISAGQQIHVIGTAVLGTTALSASMSRLSACHQPAGGGALVDNNADWSPIRLTVNNRVPMTVSQRISGIPAGTYNVGMCYQMASGQAANWNDNVWANTRILVTQN